MERQIQRLNELVIEFIGKTPLQIRSKIGAPNAISGEEEWVYVVYKNLIFHQEMVLFFENDKVVDILLQDFFLKIKIFENFYSVGI